MKALTICQPYAALIVEGVKRVENRTWATAYRGPLAIHAGKSRAWLDEDDLVTRPDMVFGAVVAVVELYGCVRVERLPVGLHGHEHAHGPWCWLLRDVRPIGPVAYRGAQGLWDLDPLVLARAHTGGASQPARGTRTADDGR